MTLWPESPILGTARPSSTAMPIPAKLPVRSWGRHREIHDPPGLVLLNLVHNPQVLLSLLGYHFLEKREGKNPQ